LTEPCHRYSIAFVGIADMVLKVRGQRSRSYVYKCVNAIMAEAYILMVLCRSLLVCVLVLFDLCLSFSLYFNVCLYCWSGRTHWWRAINQVLIDSNVLRLGLWCLVLACAHDRNTSPWWWPWGCHFPGPLSWELDNAGCVNIQLKMKLALVAHLNNSLSVPLLADFKTEMWSLFLIGF